MSNALVNADAILSPDGRYRYLLRRTWSPEVVSAVFVMLNPSTADATVDDPTIRRCMSFAREWGCGGIRVVNLYALRSTDPTQLWAVNDPVGPDNDTHLAWALDSDHSPIVCAWGTNARQDRVDAFLELAAGRERPLFALGLTKNGHPRHPLYVKGGTPLVRFSGGQGVQG